MSKRSNKIKQPAPQLDIESCDEDDNDEETGLDEVEFNDYMQNFAVWFQNRGELKEIEIDGKQVPLYEWRGVTSRGKRVSLQLWRHHAAVFANFVE